MRPNPCQQQACQATQQSKHQTLSQKLLHQASARSADGETNTNLFASRRRPGQQEISNIGACDQQHQDGRRKQNQELLLQLTPPDEGSRTGATQKQPLIERLLASLRSQSCRIAGFQNVAEKHTQFSLRFAQTYIRFQPAKDRKSVV